MVLKGIKTRKKELKGKKTVKLVDEWVPLESTRKRIGKNDIFVLGHPEVEMPAVVSRSNRKGIKCRLVTYNNKSVPTSYKRASDIPDPSTREIKVIKEWVFDDDEETLPVYFERSENCMQDLWVEMCNPLEIDAIVNATIHGLIRSRRVR